MNEVDTKNRFAVALDGQEEADKKFDELKAFKGKQAVQDVTKARQWKRGGHGFIEDTKPNDMVRLILESYNNLQYFTDKKRHTRIHTIDHTRKRLQGDLIAGVEPGTDWTIAKRLGGDTYHNLFGMGEDRKSVCSHNETK